jgi:hypothetical protein
LEKIRMPNEELLALLSRARRVLEHYLVDEDEVMRDDVAQVCMAIDDALPDASRVTIKSAARLERSLGDVAA